MLNMDPFFRKFTLPVIKTEDLSETIDVNPKNTVKQWDLEVTEKFMKHTFFTNERELDTIMKTYVSSLKTRAIHFKDKLLLKEKILNHVKILQLCFKGREQNFVADASYFPYMEEILAIYCNLELGLARHLRRNEMSTKDYNHQINAISRRICKMLSIFLERKKHIIHVLLKLTFRSNVHVHQYIMRLVFMHFLMKSPLENLSDEAFCRYYLAFERYKEVSTEDCRSKMDDALFLRFQKKPDFLKTSDIMKKVLRPANYSITGIINHLIDYKSVTVQAYFDYMKNKNCEELPDVINILNFHDEEQSKDESNFGRVYDDVIKSFTNKPSSLEIKEEECIELDSDSDVAVTSDGLIQLILGDSDDEISEIAFMENSINNKHKSRKKRRVHDAYPIVSYIDLDSDIPTSSCEELTQTSSPTTTIASISTSVQSLSLNPQSVMTVNRSQQTSPLKESDSSVCESMLCENSNACSTKYPSKECRSQVEEEKRTTFKAVEIQTDPIVPRSTRLKENCHNPEIFANEISESATYITKKSVGVDPMHRQYENESCKENHHLHKPIKNDLFNWSKRIYSAALNNSMKKKLIDSEVECIDLIMEERNEIANNLVKNEITKTFTSETSTDVAFLKLSKEIPLSPNAQLPQMPKASISTSPHSFALNSQLVKTVSRSQQTSQGIENNIVHEENFIDITNETSPKNYKVNDCKEEKRVAFKVVETQTAEMTDELEDITMKTCKTSTLLNSFNNAKEYRMDSMDKHREENCQGRTNLMEKYGNQICKTRRRKSVAFNDYKSVDSEAQCDEYTQERNATKNEENFLKEKITNISLKEKITDNSLKEKIIDTSPEEKNADTSAKKKITGTSSKGIGSITETIANIKVQNASESLNDANKKNNASFFGIVIDENVSSPEVEFIETDPNMQNVTKSVETLCKSSESKNNKQNDEFENESECLIDTPQTNQGNSNVLQSVQGMEVDVPYIEQNSTPSVKEGTLDVNDKGNFIVKSGAEEFFSSSSSNLLHEEDNSKSQPAVQDNNNESNNSVNEMGSKDLPVVDVDENTNISESVQNISGDNLSRPNKNLDGINSNDFRVSEFKIDQQLNSDFGKKCVGDSFVNNSLNVAVKNHDGQFEDVGSIGSNEKSSASVKDKICLEERPSLSESSLESRGYSFEKEEPVMQHSTFKENLPELSSPDKIPVVANKDATKDADIENDVANSITDGEQFSGDEIEPNKNIDKPIESEGYIHLAEDEGGDQLIQKRKLNESKSAAHDKEISSDVFEVINKERMKESLNQDASEGKSIDKLNKNCEDTNGLKFNSKNTCNNINNRRISVESRNSHSSSKKYETRKKRRKTKRTMRASDPAPSLNETVDAAELSVPEKIQRNENFLEPNIEAEAPTNCVEFLEQSFTAEEPTVQPSISNEIVRPGASEVAWPVGEHNVSNININTSNVVIYNFIIQNPVTEEVVASENITDITEVISSNDISIENPEQCNTDENAGETMSATNDVVYAEQFPSENELPVEAEVPPTVEDAADETNEVSDDKNDNDQEDDMVQGTMDIDAGESTYTKNNENEHEDEKSNKARKTVYTCEFVKEIPLEEFSRMEKRFSHLLNSSERDEFEDVFSGPVTRLSKNSSNSSYYENSNSFKFDLFSFAKSQPMFCSNLEEKDFVLENKGNSPESSRSGSPTISPEYEVFDWSDFGSYMEQSHMQKKDKGTKHKAKQQLNKSKPVKKCKFSETVRTRIIDSDSEYSDHLVPMNSFDEPKCEHVLWKGLQCFIPPRDPKLHMKPKVMLNKVSEKELAYRIFRPNVEKFVYQESQPYNKPRHNTSRSCIQQKLDFNKDNNSHRTEAYARLGNFVSSNYPTEDYALGVGGLNSSNYVPTTRISDKGSFEYEEFSKPSDNKKGFSRVENDGLSVSSTPQSRKRGRPSKKNVRANSEDQFVYSKPKRRRKGR